MEFFTHHHHAFFLQKFRETNSLTEKSCFDEIFSRLGERFCLTKQNDFSTVHNVRFTIENLPRNKDFQK